MEQSQQALPEELAVAVIGMSGRFPGAADIGEFWQNLISGVESIVQFDPQTLLEQGVSPEMLQHHAYVCAGAPMVDAEYFDAQFFNMTPREAQITDPQHRVLLECAYQALEHAGYDPQRYPGAIGVYAGVGLNTYLLSNLMPNQTLLQSMGMHQLLLGNDKCYATSRISYKLNLRGPCLSIDTACSSGLVSVLTAYKALISYECDMALAGGAKVNSADVGYMYEAGSINSPDGHCRTFDADASGTVFGSGAAVLLLKRLEDALADRDNILAVIRGGAVNNDGADKVGFTAPSVSRQRDVITQALQFSEVPAASISYVEAHGTGTRLGDPVELNALQEAFGVLAPQSCYIGSVKPNIGHLESAAGVAGLIKVICAMQNEQIPATLHFQTPNPAFDFAGSPFQVVRNNTGWPRGLQPRRASVSSFGLGGTNAHLIVEEAPWCQRQDDGFTELLLVSAKSEAALAQSVLQQQNALLQAPSLPLQDVAYTLAVGRQAMPVRSFAVLSRQQTADSGQWFSPAVQRAAAPAAIAFIFPGQGVQHAGMSRDLYHRFAVFRQTLEQCCQLYLTQTGVDLKPLLLASVVSQQLSDAINQTSNAQPCIFIHAYALAQQLLAWGVKPDWMCGHSLGEYVAATLSGVLSLPAALQLVAGRAALMTHTADGAMLSVSAAVDVVTALLAQQNLASLEIAAVNGPSAVVLSGLSEQISQAAAHFTDLNIANRLLQTSGAFHSRLLDPLMPAFRKLLSQINFGAPTLPYISSLTGQAVTARDVQDPDYWCRHWRDRVEFSAAIQSLQANAVECFIDIGPSTAAATMVREQLAGQPAISVLTASNHVRQTSAADQTLLRMLGQFWSVGGEPDWSAFYQDRECHRVALPTYPFQKLRHWVDATSVATPVTANAGHDHKVPDHKVAPPAPSAAVTDDRTGAPRNEIEALLAAIWQDLLGLSSVSVTANFFELGGQSLLATRVLTRVYEETGVELNVSVIFNTPTIEALAIAVLEQQMLQTDPQALEQLLAELDA